jgi:lysophospholipase L1-like esterase
MVMVKRIIAAVSALGIGLAGGMSIVFSAPATAQGTGDNPSGAGDIIWQGLWEGANFDLSSLDSSTTTPPTTPQPSTPDTSTGKRYVALGDSVAAGLGLPLMPSTDTRCGRSEQAYAFAVGSKLNMNVDLIACSGAKVGDLFTRQGMDGPNMKPQLDVAFAAGKPDLISITAGANDVHWSEFVNKCYAMSCGSRSDTYVADGYLSFMESKLYYAFYDIATRSHGNPPPVVVTGYYNPLSPACSTLEPRLTASEIAWLTSQSAKLNDTLRSVTQQFSFAKFAPVDFTGHDVCAADSWIQRPGDTAPFHPTAAGQQAIARSVLQAAKQ